MKLLLLIFIVCCSCFSCERRSRRKATGGEQPFYSQNESKERQQSHIPIRGKIKAASNTVVISGSEIFEKFSPAVFMIYTSDGYSNLQGSGFFISGNGIAVSNYHVFQGTTKGSENIKLTDGRTFKVEEVIGYDQEEDYIIFKVAIGTQQVKYLPICSSMPKVGEKAYAIGSPRGLENTFSSGEISQIRDKNILQISVPIDHGSSGGALLNSHGEVIGITTAGLNDSGANLNFAMSINVIQKYIR